MDRVSPRLLLLDLRVAANMMRDDQPPHVIHARVFPVEVCGGCCTRRIHAILCARHVCLEFVKTIQLPKPERLTQAKLQTGESIAGWAPPYRADIVGWLWARTEQNDINPTPTVNSKLACRTRERERKENSLIIARTCLIICLTLHSLSMHQPGIVILSIYTQPNPQV